MTQIFEGTVQERRAFHRFKLRTVPAFAGGSEVDFWTSLVLQAAHREPVIRVAVIALGTLHEHYESRAGQYDLSVNQDSSHKEAGLLYGKAIRDLYQRIDRSKGETAKLAVIASILFACFEVLRRNNMAAVVHYQAGMRQLIGQMKTRQYENALTPPSTEEYETALVRPEPENDLDRMLRVFARYDIQACTFSKPRAETLAANLPPSPPTSVALTEVRCYLDNLLIAAYQLIKSDLAMYRYWKAESVSDNWHKVRGDGVQTFQSWLTVLDQSIPSDVVTLRKNGLNASKSMLGLVLQVRIAIMMLQTSIDCGPETTFDQFHEEFEEMVTRVETLTEALNMREGDPLGAEQIPFTMELGCVHPLFFIAWKSRDYNLRRRAMVQLRKCGKEGVWEGPIMAVLAQKIADIEEQGLQPGDFVPEMARVHEIRKEVQYDERLVRAEIKLALDDSWKNWTVLRQAIPF